jgi:hypothetical protein
MKKKLVQRLYDEICQIEIIDTYEHLVNREMLKALGFNALYAIEIEYLKDDLLALGMPENLILEKGPDPQALLRELLPLLRQTENTT